MLRITNPEPGSREHGYVAHALEHGELVVVPTDTVYGIAALATSREACGRLYLAKGRDPGQPTAVVFPDLDLLIDTIPDLSLRARIACEMLLPGPYTLVVGNPTGVLPWLCGATPGAIGVRVPAGALDLPPLAATSANLPGEPEIEVVAALPAAIAAQVACAIDAGPLPEGGASTVLDLTAWEAADAPPDPALVRVLRDPAGRSPAALDLLARIRS